MRFAIQRINERKRAALLVHFVALPTEDRRRHQVFHFATQGRVRRAFAGQTGARGWLLNLFQSKAVESWMLLLP